MAIVGTAGQTVTVAAADQGNFTFIDTVNPATANGKIYKITIQIGSDGFNASNTTAVKIFRINGTNYDVVYNQALTNLIVGSNVVTLTTPQSILVGDLLGFWTGAAGATSNAHLGYQAGGTCDSKNGDITITTAIADWTERANTRGLRADIIAYVGGYSGFSPHIF